MTTATTAATITGVSDEQLEMLVRGRWVDDGSSSVGWRRWLLVDDSGDDEGPLWRRVEQWVFPFDDLLGWHACHDLNKEEAWVNSLDTALKLCDDWAKGSEIEATSGTATKQEDRFAKMADG